MPVKKTVKHAKNKASKKGVPKVGKKVSRVRKVGRPDGFSWAVGEQVLDAVASGESLTNACGHLPVCRQTVSAWVRKGAAGTDADLLAFAKGFVLACQLRVAMLEDDFVELIRRIRATGDLQFTEQAAVRFKLEMDGLKWYLGRFRVGANVEGVDEALERLNDAGESSSGGFRMVVHRAEAGS